MSEAGLGVWRGVLTLCWKGFTLAEPTSSDISSYFSRRMGNGNFYVIFPDFWELLIQISPEFGTGQTKHICGLNLTKRLPIHNISRSMHGKAWWMGGCCLPDCSTNVTVGEKGANRGGGARKSTRHLSHTLAEPTLFIALWGNHCYQ